MEVCGQALRSSHLRWHDPPHDESKKQIISSASSNLNFLNPVSPRVYKISYSKGAGQSYVPTAITHGLWDHQWQQQAYRWSFPQFPVSTFQLPNCSSLPAHNHQIVRSTGRDKAKPQFCHRISLSPSAGSERTQFSGASAVPSGSLSDNVGSSATREEHVEQLEEFYNENEFLFADETWGALGQAEEGAVGTPTPSPENLSLPLTSGRLQRGSRVLVWGGSPAFVQQLILATSPASLVVTHFSFLVLAAIKELNDDVVCWHGDIEELPDSYGPFDAVFLNSLIAAAHSPSRLLRNVASLCKPGVRIVICCTQGRQNLAGSRGKNPQLILRDLPDVADLEKMISALPLNIVELQDEPAFYLATLEVTGTSRASHTQDDSGEVSEAFGLPTGFTSHQKFPLRARGHIVQGFGRGSKQMGIPTANIDPVELPREIRELSKGVYFGWAQQAKANGEDGGVYKMVMNIGNRPTFADGEQVTVEVHIMHYFSADFYGDELSIIVLGFIRDEMRFKSLDELVQRINTDITNAEKLLDEDEMFQFSSDAFFVRS